MFQNGKYLRDRQFLIIRMVQYFKHNINQNTPIHLLYNFITDILYII